MIRSRKTTRKPPASTRTFDDIVAFPLTDDEEHQADAYIRRACAEIQATWSERERASREVQPAESWHPVLMRSVEG